MRVSPRCKTTTPFRGLALATKGRVPARVVGKRCGGVPGYFSQAFFVSTFRLRVNATGTVAAFADSTETGVVEIAAAGPGGAASDTCWEPVPHRRTSGQLYKVY